VVGGLAGAVVAVLAGAVLGDEAATVVGLLLAGGTVDSSTAGADVVETAGSIEVAVDAAVDDAAAPLLELSLLQPAAARRATQATTNDAARCDAVIRVMTGIEEHNATQPLSVDVLNVGGLVPQPRCISTSNGPPYSVTPLCDDSYMRSWELPEVDELAMLSPAALGLLGFEVERERSRSVARVAMMAWRVSRSGAHLVDGHRTVKAWLMATTNMAAAEAARTVRVGNLFGRFPEVAAVAAEGRLGVAQMHALAGVVANPRVQAHLHDDTVRILLGQALELTAADYGMFLAQWESLADADGAGDRHEHAHRNRKASLSLIGERSFLDACGGVAAGTAMKAVLDAYTRTEWEADWNRGVAQHGDLMHPNLLARTDQQRRFDALHAIFEAAAARNSAGATGTSPTTVVNIVVGLERFEHELAKACGAQPEPLDPNNPAHACRTSDGTIIDPHDMLTAALTGHVRRMVVDSAGVIVDVGRKQRLFTGPVRDAILLSERTCIWPGCTRPATECQADHLIPWANAGPTSPSNGAPICGHHNRWKTRGYRTWRDLKGHWHHERPDGTPLSWRAHIVPLDELLATAGR